MNLLKKLPTITHNDILNESLFSEAPELAKLKTNIEMNSWHGGENTLEHIANVFKNFTNIVSQHIDLQKYFQKKSGTFSKFDLFKLAILYHDIAKPDTTTISADGNTSCPNHEELSVQQTKILLGKYKELDFDSISYVLFIIKNHGYVHEILDAEIIDKETLKKEFIQSFGELSLEMAIMGYADIHDSYLLTSNKKDYEKRQTFFKWFICSFIT